MGSKWGEKVERRWREGNTCEQLAAGRESGEDLSGDLRESEVWYVPLGHSESKVTLHHQNGDQGPLDHWPGGMHARTGFPVCLSLSWSMYDPGCFTPKLLYSSWAILLFFQHITYTQHTSSLHT